jgi:predicted extracellular nuclease
MKLRISAFNCENLFGRYRFLNTDPAKRGKNYEQKIQIYEVVALAGRSGKTKPDAISEKQRKNTAAAIIASAPDVLAVEEVENLITLRLFNALYAKNYFDRMVLIDGNDPRGIDVGFLIKRGVAATITGVRSHSDDAKLGGYLPSSNRLDVKNCLGNAIYSRDCLEVDVDVAGKSLTFLCNHFKAQDGKPESIVKRKGQSTAVSSAFGACRARGRTPIVLGDLNIDTQQATYDQSLDPLVSTAHLFDPFLTLPTNDRWTHYFASKNSVSRLDYILIDDTFRNAVDGVEIFRGGLSPKCKQYAGQRIGTIAKDGLEASDHCPVTLVLNL